MASYRGQDGVVKIGGNAVGEVKEFTVDEVAEVIDVTAKGDTARKKKAGHTSWSGSMTCNLDHGNAPQEAVKTALGAGTDVALVLAPAGVAVKTLNGNAVVTGRKITSPEGSAVTTLEVTFEGNGALTATDPA